jgi:TPR repeat protein
LALATKAVEIEPGESYHRFTLARALWHLRRPDDAVKAAQSALPAADDESERKEAQGQGVARDCVRALSTLQGLCGEGFDDGCVGWAIVLASGSRSDVAKAKQLLEAICDRGSAEACALSKSMPR